MSWIIGVVGEKKLNIHEKLNHLIQKPILRFEDDNLLIMAGGNTQTCHLSPLDNKNNNFLAVGVGINTELLPPRIMGSSDWFNISDQSAALKLNGHFILIRWDNNEIKIFTDKLGLRDIYLHKYSDNSFIFSTRADWIARVIKTRLNFKEFGSRWLLFNQISSNSIFENIERLSGGTNVVINRNNLNISKSYTNWIPTNDEYALSISDFSKTIKNLCTIPFQNNIKTSLSLSGGMDSRVILSFLVGSESHDWNVHTFGDKNHPDSILARKISSKLGIDHEQINLPFPEKLDCVDKIQEYVSQTMLNNAASAYIQQNNYLGLINENAIIIDGGFGEIWRREYLNRLLITGKNALINKNAKGIVPYLRIQRADVFNEEIKKKMLEGCQEQVETKINELPDMNLLGIENFIDLFAIKTRLVNYASHEQMRLDSLIVCYMPFIQPTLIENLFRIQINMRKNGKMFRKLIAQNYPALQKFPLVKGKNIYPYRLNTIQTRIWSVISKKIDLKTYQDNNSRKLIYLLSPFIQDTINSKSVHDYEYYNIQKLLRLSDSLRKKELTELDIHELDWWLAFELFRKHTYL